MAIRRTVIGSLLLTLAITAAPPAVHAAQATATVQAVTAQAAAAVPTTPLRLVDIRSHDGVVLKGNLIGPANPWQPPDEGYRHLDQVVAWNRIEWASSRRRDTSA